MLIGEVARATGCHVETIRYYERIGLVDPPRRIGNGYRDYDASRTRSLRFIRRARELGFSLEEIRELLTLRQQPGDSCQAVSEVTSRHLANVRQRIRDLRAMENELARMAAACNDGSVATCHILESLAGEGGE